MISVIVPTLNAEATLLQTLSPLVRAAMSGLIKEVIVVDGGSTDYTVDIADEAGATVIQTERGRGNQLAAGAEVARGAWLLFLHADTRLLKNWEDEVDQFVADPRNKKNAAAFRFALDDYEPAARWLERIVRWRCAVLHLPYGDQGLLIGRSFYREIGGFKQIALMEDVDIVRRIGWSRMRLLDNEAMTSADRYRRDGYWRRPLKNFWVLTLYFFGVSPDRLLRIYSA